MEFPAFAQTLCSFPHFVLTLARPPVVGLPSFISNMVSSIPPTLHCGLRGLTPGCFLLQALMTGSLPGFVDVIRNLNSPSVREDNVLTQAKAAGKRIIFYGDDTWVKLFPKHFVEYDGTTSFFVSDYTEVSLDSKNVCCTR